MTDKLTDSEVKKALECCANLEACEKCPMASLQKYDSDTCEHQIMLYALDLINRQDQENESLKAEVERLQNAYKQCAWERDIFAEDMKEEIKKDCSYLMLDIKTIKAEAYKEFAERLKDESEHFELEKENFVSENQIDNLLNELVGDA